jgi:hypothetical protein
LKNVKQQANLEPQLNARHFLVDDEYSKPNELPRKSLIRLQDAKRVVFYNSLASERVQVVTLRISEYNVEVKIGIAIHFHNQT